MQVLFLTKEEMGKSGTGKKTSESEQKELNEIIKKNGYKKGYRGSRIMVDDIIMDDEYPSA